MTEKEINFDLNNESIFVQKIKNPDKPLKNLLNLILFLGSLSFSAVGIATYLNKSLFGILENGKIIFFPQGFTMLIYGSLGFFFSINQFLIVNFNIGEGFNIFDKKTGEFKILRKDSYFTNMKLVYSINDIVRNGF